MIATHEPEIELPDRVYVPQYGINGAAVWITLYGRVCEFESPAHPNMRHHFDAYLVCVGCGTDWNEHQLSGVECSNPYRPAHGEPRRGPRTQRDEPA